MGDSEGGGKGEGELMQQTIQIGAASHANIYPFIARLTRMPRDRQRILPEDAVVQRMTNLAFS